MNSRLDKTFVIPNAAIEFLEMRTYSICQKASATELKVQILSEVKKKTLFRMQITLSMTWSFFMKVMLESHSAILWWHFNQLHKIEKTSVWNKSLLYSSYTYLQMPVANSCCFIYLTHMSSTCSTMGWARDFFTAVFF